MSEVVEMRALSTPVMGETMFDSNVGGADGGDICGGDAGGVGRRGLSSRYPAEASTKCARHSDLTYQYGVHRLVSGIAV